MRMAGIEPAHTFYTSSFLVFPVTHKWYEKWDICIRLIFRVHCLGTVTSRVPGKVFLTQYLSILCRIYILFGVLLQRFWSYVSILYSFYSWGGRDGFLERDGFQSAPLVSLSQDCTSILSVRQTPLAFRLSFLLQPCEGSSEGFVRNGNIPFSSDFICHLFSLLATHLILLSTPFLVDLCGTLIWRSGLSTDFLLRLCALQFIECINTIGLLPVRNPVSILDPYLVKYLRVMYLLLRG